MMDKLKYEVLRVKREESCTCSKPTKVRKYLGYWQCVCGKLIQK